MRKMNSVFAVSLALVAVIVIIIVLQWGAPVDTPSITIPSPSSSIQGNDDPSGNPPLKVSADTVQDLIALIERPDSYSRKFRVTTYWTGGEAVAEVSVFCKGEQYRIKHSLNGSVKNTLFSDGKMHIWYDGSNAVATVSKNLDEKADWYARLIIFEELLDIPQEDIITVADVVFLDENCIYVEYHHSEKYVYRLHISVDKGLLVSAEILENGKTVGTLEAEKPDLSIPSDEFFTLPPR